MQAASMAATQRPVTQEALVEPSGSSPLWKDVPSWFLFGDEDRNVPVALQRYMAQRAEAVARSRSQAPRTRSPWLSPPSRRISSSRPQPCARP